MASASGSVSTRRAAFIAPTPMASLAPWQRRVAQERSAARLEQTAQVSTTRRREVAAAARVAHLKARIQRETLTAARVEAVRDVHERKRLAAREVAEESDKLVGRDVTRLLADAPIPDEIEVVELSQLFNEQVVKHCPPEQRDFHKLFKAMDLDGSHRISFAELSAMARRTLRLGEGGLPPERLASLWKALDQNASGFIDAGELARFLRRGQDADALSPAQLARQRLLASRRRGAAAAHAETDELFERATVEQLASVEAASDKEMRRLAVVFLKRMGSGVAGELSSNVQRIFSETDRDGTGLVTLEEFTRMVRRDLHLNVSTLSDEKCAKPLLCTLPRP